MIILLPLLFALVGLLMFVMAHQNPDVKEVGRIMFFCGLLAFLLHVDLLVTVLPK